MAEYGPELLGCVLLAVTFAVTLRVGPWSRDVANDFGLYRSDGQAFLHGALPYRDLFFEYPPLAAPLMALPAAVASGLWSYLHVFALEMYVFGCVLVFAMGRVAISAGISRRVATLAVGVSPFFIGAVSRSRFDLAPVAMTGVTLWLLLRDRPRLGLAVLGAAVVTKGFPAAVVPVALAWVWARGGRRVAWHSAATCAGVGVVVMGAALAVAPHGVIDSVRFQLGRPLQIESTAASILFAFSHLGAIAHPQTLFGHREWQIAATGSGVSVIAVEILGLLTVAALSAGVLRRPSPERLALAVGAALAAYAAFTAAFSPQYILWSLPLLAVSAAAKRWLIAVPIAGAMVLTMFEYGHFDAVVLQQSTWVAVLIARNMLVIAAIWLTAAYVAGARLASLRLRRVAVAAALSSGS